MATYGEFYFRVLEHVNNGYLGLHNLSELDQFDKKTKCYKDFEKEPNKYYECFR